MPLNNAMPKVKVYPLCSTCRAPYVLRRCLVMSFGQRPSGEQWLWQRDCKHKKAIPLSSNSPALHAEAPRAR